MSSTHISSGFVLSFQDILNPNQPRLCWQSFVDPDNVTATSETDENPVTNLTNPATSFVWQASSTAQQDIDFGVEGEVDYIGIARHNFGGATEVRLQFKIGTDYVTVRDWFQPPLQQTILILFNIASPDEVRISIRGNVSPPILGVVYIGRATVIQRRIYVGHTPITYGRNVQTVGAVSESGQYLGELVRRESRSTSIALQNLTPQWYRDELDPFVSQRPRRPAFFAWRPQSYPNEVGYMWLSGNARPSNQRPNGMMQITLNMDGIA